MERGDPVMSGIPLHELNQLDQDSFVHALGGIYENSPWVAQAAWHERPFHSLDDLHQAMSRAVRLAGAARQLALIQAHPELGWRLSDPGMSESSRQEQASAGLHRLSPQRHERLRLLNRSYRQRFGFPFVMAVKGASLEAVLASLERRLKNDIDEEFATALAEIDKIALGRLLEVVRP